MLSHSSALGGVLRVPGALAVSMVHLASGSRIGLVRDPERRGQFDADSGVVVQVGVKVMESCGPGQHFEELVISSKSRFHVLRTVLDGTGRSSDIVHLELDRSKANLALARMDLKAVVECLPDFGNSRPPVFFPSAPEPLPDRVAAPAGVVAAGPTAPAGPTALLPRRVPVRQPPRACAVAAAPVAESPEVAARRQQATSRSTLQRIAAALRRLE